MIMALSMGAFSQDREYPFSIFASTEPGAYDDGANIGLGIDYQMDIIYIKTQTFMFPELNNTTYIDLTGSVGLNWHIGRFDVARLYGGSQAGFIRRGGHTYPTIGPELGLDVNITERLYIGSEVSYMIRQDGRLFDPLADDYWRTNVKLRIGFRF